MGQWSKAWLINVRHGEQCPVLGCLILFIILIHIVYAIYSYSKHVVGSIDHYLRLWVVDETMRVKRTTPIKCQHNYSRPLRQFQTIIMICPEISQICNLPKELLKSGGTEGGGGGTKINLVLIFFLLRWITMSKFTLCLLILRVLFVYNLLYIFIIWPLF